MSNSASALRRWLGMFCLAIATGMMIWGRTFLAPHLSGSRYILYWIGCTLFALAAVGISCADVWYTVRRMQAERRELVRITFDRLQSGPAEAEEVDVPLHSAASQPAASDRIIPLRES